MKKILMTTGITVLMMILFLGLGMTASAENYGPLVYEVVDGEAIIKDCDVSISGDVVIPDTIDGYPVTEIDDVAFLDCGNIVSVTIGNNVKKIGSTAFHCCKDLESVIISDSVTEIEAFAFSWCNNLKNVHIGKNVKILGEDLFDCCENLEYIEIPGGIEIMNGTFGWSGLKLVKILDGVTVIPDGAFAECHELESIIIPDSVTKIGDFAFEGCTSLKNISLSESVEHIGVGAFNGSGIEEIIINNPKCYIADDVMTIYDTIMTIPETTVIHGDINSTAHWYAIEYNREFVPIETSFRFIYEIVEEFFSKIVFYFKNIFDKLFVW